MTRECHVRIWESLGVKLPGDTRPPGTMDCGSRALNERTGGDKRIESNIRFEGKKQSRLSWRCLKDSHITANRVDSGQVETYCLKERPPFTLTSFSAACNGKHVEVAHQVAFKVLICLTDQWRQYELDDQQSAVLRNHGAAVS